MKSFGSQLLACIAFIGCCGLPAYAQDAQPMSDEDAQIYSIVKGYISQESFLTLSPIHKNMAARILSGNAVPTTDRAMCFTGDVPDDVMAVFNSHFYGTDAKYEAPSSAWSTTATDGAVAPPAQFTLTYSFVPDGTLLEADASVGNADAPSNLFAFLDGIYGSTAAWQAEFAQMFADWSAVTGIQYVFEPNDDGAAMPEAGVSNGSPGVAGVRGDIRIGGYSIDGDGAGILAFNFFPDSGDMFIDTDNITFFSNLSNDSLALRNTIAHEHGHGLGLNHTCPTNNTKLMEPFISAAFDGPQLDDVLAAQLNYGDANAGNDTTGTATDLGSLSETTASTSGASISGLGESDFYQFALDASQDITVTVTPTGSSYLSGEQLGDGNCTAGTAFDTLNFIDLSVQLIAPNGSTVLATGSANGVGAGETVMVSTNAGQAGTYFARVFAASGQDQTQAYDLSVTVAAGEEPPVLMIPPGAPVGGLVGFAALGASLLAGGYLTMRRKK